MLALEIARRHFGHPRAGQPVAARDVAGLLADSIAHAPEVWHQRSYLAQVVSLDPSAGPTDDGIVPLTAFLDAGGPDALAVTLEADGTGAIYPVVYVRQGGATTERALEPDPLVDFSAARYRAAVRAIAADLHPSLGDDE